MSRVSDVARTPAVRVVAVMVLAAASVSCKEDDKGKDADSAPVTRRDGGVVQCKRPPLALCKAPPLSTCSDKWECPGCVCEGPASVAACDPFTLDCRWFCTGCFPDEYVRCDEKADPRVLGRCGFCFASDAGPGRCDNLSKKDGG